MQPYQLKEKRKTNISARSSPRNTRSRKAAAIINSATYTKEGATTNTEGTSTTQDTKQVSNMSSPNHTPPPSDPNVKLSIEDMIGNLSAQFSTFDSAIKRMDDNISATRAEMNSNQTSINSQLKDLIDQNKVLEDKLSTANERIITLENLYFDLYHKQERDLMNKQAMNLILRGIPETQNERMHETVGELLDAVGSFTYINTNGATRLGNHNKARVNDPTVAPRPIRLRCATVLQKGEVFRALDKLKKK